MRAPSDRLRAALFALQCSLPTPAYRWGRRLGRLPGRLAAQRSARDAALPLGSAERVAAVWNHSPTAQPEAEGMFWMGHPHVARRLCEKASGSPDIDAYGHLRRSLEAKGWRFPVARLLSLGCGHGALERGLAALGFAERYDGVDLAPRAIREARRLAAEAGFAQVRYHLAALEQLDVPPGAFDVVVAHQSLHHVCDLDGVLRRTRQALRRGGILHLHEFVGPDRFQWTDVQLRHINRFIGQLPARYRRLPSGRLRGPVLRPTLNEMLRFDPSEAVRSSAILDAVERHFRIVELRPLGGALLHVGLANIAQNFDPAKPEDMAYLKDFFALEDWLMSESVIGSDYVTVTAIRD